MIWWEKIIKLVYLATPEHSPKQTVILYFADVACYFRNMNCHNILDAKFSEGVLFSQVESL